MLKRLFRFEKYEIKKSRYPDSYYDVYKIKIFGITIWYSEHKNNRYY